LYYSSMQYSTHWSWYFSEGIYPPYSMGLFKVFCLIVSDLIFPVCVTVFLALNCLSLILALSAKELPGFGWLVAGFSLPLFTFLLGAVLDLFYKSDEAAGFALLPFILIFILTFPILMIIGASLFTLKMDPAQLEERLRKASPAKEVESVN